MKSWIPLVLLVGCAQGEETAAPGGDGGRLDARGGSGSDAPADRPDASEPRFDAQPFADAGARPDAAAGGGPDGACAGTWVELLTNADFDDGPEPWTQASGLGTDILLADDELPILPDSPHCAAWMGGYDDALDQLYQEVTVPPNATALRIRGKRCFATAETGGAAFDFLSVALLDPAFTPLEYLTWSNLDAAETCTFTAFELSSVDSHAGEDLILYWEAVTDGSINTNFFLDTLAFEAFVPGC